MASSNYQNLVILPIGCSCASLASAQDRNKPLADRELPALVAGNALSENIAHEIESRSLAFRPSDTYRSQLTTAGADARVLTALNKVGAAGKLMRAKQYQETAEELNGALQANGSVEAGLSWENFSKCKSNGPWRLRSMNRFSNKTLTFPKRTRSSVTLGIVWEIRRTDCAKPKPLWHEPRRTRRLTRMRRYAAEHAEI
jgi:hypothetical protein